MAAGVLAGAALVVGAVALVRPLRVALQTLLLLPSLFASAPLDPLVGITPAPQRAEQQLVYAAGTLDVDIYRPGGRGPYGGFVFQYQGPRPAPRRDPALVRFVEGFARLGVVVLVPESSSFRAGQVVPEERDAVRRAYELLLAQPDVDPTRTGIIGFSVGGSISLVVASTEPGVRDRVRFVNLLGSYGDAERLLVDVVSRSMLVDGRVVAWEPSEQPLEILADLLVGSLADPRERSLLERVLRERVLRERQVLAAPEQAPLGPDARLVLRLLEGTPTRDEAQALVASLPAASRERLAALSPARSLDGLRARLFLMHDTGDTYVPYAESRSLAAAAGPRLGRYTEFSIFSHVVPDKPVPWQIFLPDLWALYWHAHAVLLELL